MLLRHYLQRGVSKAALARRFGVSRRTIHEWVETGQLDRDLASGGARYAPRPAVPHKLAPYTGIIEARLEEFPGLSAKRLFDEVRAAGYPGGYSRVRDYVRAVRPREPVEAVVRFETPPGRQGQVDFATFTLPWGRRHALVVVLIEGLERAFARFGGVPKELLFDQMRAVVLSDGVVARIVTGRTMPPDTILTCRCDMTLVGRGRSSDSGSHSRGRPHSPGQLDSGREGHRR